MAHQLTYQELHLLRYHGFPWHPGYTPTIRIETRNLRRWTPSCRTVQEAEMLRRLCCRMGIGYFDGQQTIGQKELNIHLIQEATQQLWALNQEM